MDNDLYWNLHLSRLCKKLNLGIGLEFEKWRGLRASVGGAGGVLVWVTC